MKNLTQTKPISTSEIQETMVAVPLASSLFFQQCQYQQINF